MAISSATFFEDHKNKSIDELKAILKQLNSIRTKIFVFFAIREERRMHIDDNSTLTNITSEKEVLKLLIEIKENFPDICLSNVGYIQAKKIINTQ